MPQTIQQRRQQEYREMESHRIEGVHMSEPMDKREEVKLSFEAFKELLDKAMALESANREKDTELRDRNNHIDLTYDALGDVNRSVYLFDHIREQKAEIERLKALDLTLQAQRDRLFEVVNGIADANWRKWQDGLNTPGDFIDWSKSIASQAVRDVEKLGSLRASVGEKPIFWPCKEGHHGGCSQSKSVDCDYKCHKSTVAPTLPGEEK